MAGLLTNLEVPEGWLLSNSSATEAGTMAGLARQRLPLR